jgi:hypothetical protein
MANIIVNNSAFVCENPVFTGVTYPNVYYQVSLSWTSLGGYYLTFDPTTTITLHMELHRIGATPYFSGFISPPIPFNGNNFIVNILDYSNIFSPKDIVVFTLTITNQGCDNSIVYTIPSNTIPNLT